jgi:hypothetical protein
MNADGLAGFDQRARTMDRSRRVLGDAFLASRESAATGWGGLPELDDLSYLALAARALEGTTVMTGSIRLYLEEPHLRAASRARGSLNSRT